MRIDRAVRSAASRLVGERITAIAPWSEGANARVFRVETARETFALKSYSTRRADTRNRLEVEWKALRFMRAHGIEETPRVHAYDAGGRYLLMEWIEGAPVDRHSFADLGSAAGFIVRVLCLSTEPGAAEFPPAAEACLSAAEIVRQIDHRLCRFTPQKDIDDFLSAQFRPAFEAARQSIAGELNDGTDLPQARRRLIPADFGFHNALRQADGTLRFIDFDYFGWDDPVKLAADILSHPAMTLSEADAHAIVGRMQAALSDDVDFLGRLRRHLPLYALRWSLILLNPFRRERVSSLPDKPDARLALRAERLLKARRVLARNSKYWRQLAKLANG